MVDFNGFDKGVIGKKLPSDTTLNNMRKADLIELLHYAESNHRVLAETYKIAIDTSKCNSCPLSIDTRRAEQIRAEVLEEVEATMYHEAFEVSHEEDGLQKWDSGNWIRYKLFENVMGKLRQTNGSSIEEENG